jgi:hypothetical protein
VRRDFPALVERLRNRYSLYYAMPKAPPGDRRRVTVELAPEARRANPRAEVTARKGYRTPAEESTP